MVDTCLMKHDYQPGYNYKSPKPFINNVIVSTHVEAFIDSSQDSQHSLASIYDQYH